MKENSISEEKAMKYFYNLRATIDESNMLFDEDLNVKCGKETIKHITTVLNLIEKLQKENKELKNFRRNFVDVTDKELKEANDYFSRKYTFMGDELAQHINTLLKVTSNSISVQKVKDKIEELQNGPLKINENNKYYYETDAYNKIIIQVLQGLIEGSK